MTALGTRTAGVLLHPTSLAGRGPVGDLGGPAARFLDWAAEAGLGVWQILPLGPTGAGDSPYSALSAFAGNPLLISIDELVRAGWVSDAGSPDPPPGAVDFAAARAWKARCLREAWRGFERHAPADARRQLAAFREGAEQADWLADWALFAALKARFEGRPWTEWDRDLRRREPAALGRAGKELSGEVGYHVFLQFLFRRQWDRLRAAARARGIRLLGDAPYYVAHDSADVWAHRKLFEVDDAGGALKVAGVPPDYFSETGQLWGNPLYRWERLRDTGYAWWVSRVRANLRQVDLLRLDHFRGFAAYWEVDGGARTAIDGRWVPGPGRELFAALRRELGPIGLVAEDLGVITDDVVALREELGLPGMHVLQFGFGSDESTDHPRRHRPHALVYTGTHDNDTTRGWFDSLDEKVRARVLRDLEATPATVVGRMIDAAYGSVAALAVIPMQDLLGLGSASRMNRPGVSEGNWGWRLAPGEPTLELASRLRRRAREAGRLREA